MKEMFACLPSRMLTTDSFLKYLLAISDTSSVLRSKYAVFLSRKDSALSIWFAEEHIDIKAYLPDYEYHKLPNRQWLWNLLNTLIGDKFKAHIKATTKERAKYAINKRKMSVKALPEFISIFRKSDCVSVQNGKTHYLLKAAGRRKWNQMEDDNRDRLMKAKDEAMRLNETINSL